MSKTDPYNVRKIIMQDEEKLKLVLGRSGIFVTEENKGMRKNLYLEYIHRIARRDK